MLRLARSQLEIVSSPDLQLGTLPIASERGDVKIDDDTDITVRGMELVFYKEKLL